VDNPVTGVGAGNVKFALEDEYIARKQRVLHNFRLYDPHNQYLLAGIQAGFPGMVLLLCGFLALIVLGWLLPTHRVWLLVGAILLFSCCVESVLQRQLGTAILITGLCLGVYASRPAS
jgi:O-antigen ligase